MCFPACSLQRDEGNRTSAHPHLPLSVSIKCIVWMFSTLIDCDDKHFGKALIVAYGLNLGCSGVPTQSC